MSYKLKIALMIVMALLLLGVSDFSSMVLLQRVQADLAPTEDEEIVPMTAVVVVLDEYLPRNRITARDEAVDKIAKADLIEGQILLSNNLANPTVASQWKHSIPLFPSHPAWPR